MLIRLRDKGILGRQEDRKIAGSARSISAVLPSSEPVPDLLSHNRISGDPSTSHSTAVIRHPTDGDIALAGQIPAHHSFPITPS